MTDACSRPPFDPPAIEKEAGVVVVDDLSFSGGCNNAVCVSNTIPDTLSPGQNFTATSTIGNNGTKTWTGNSYYAGIANYASWGLTNAGAS